MNIIFEIINYALILAFGVLVSISFCTIEKTTKNSIAVWTLIISELILQFTSWYMFGFEFTSKIYPFITHIPLLLFIVFYFKKPYSLAIVSVLTAYLCCQTPNWIGYFVLFIFKSEFVYYIGKSIAIIPVYFIIKRYISPSVYKVMTYSKQSLYLFGSISLVYYLFDYITKIYTKLFYNGIEIVAEFLPFFVSIFYLLFVMIYYNEMQKLNKIEFENMVLCVQSEQSKNEIESLMEIQKQTTIYRHDMRHHLSMINSYLINKNFKQAQDYIKQAQKDINDITPQRYCVNTTVNLILSSFAEKSKAYGISFSANAQIPKNLSMSETELCSLISNGLENAIKAAIKIENVQRRTVRFDCQIHKSKLLILIENPFSEDIIFENGLPKSNRDGHGIGVLSIDAITKKNNGYCSFEPKDGIFTLRIVLPL